MINKIKNAITLCLGKKAFRKIEKRTVASMWMKLYHTMTKSLAHKIYLKQELNLFKMTKSRMMVEQVPDFNKILDYLEIIEVKLENKDKVLLFLNALQV